MCSAIIESVIGTAVAVLGEDIDTDRIIPARFLKEISFEKMGNYLFQDERFDEQGVQRKHPLNDPRFEGASILIVGKNFGCGSSREHAPQAIHRFGINAIIGVSFAEIFSGNCKSIGVPLLRVSEVDSQKITDQINKDPKTLITINLPLKRIQFLGESIEFYMPNHQLESFLSGQWNTLEILKANLDKVRDLNQKLPY
jgi:3-isopropylmalate/(R)-2-methylmalate dehydratase small subunit